MEKTKTKPQIKSRFSLKTYQKICQKAKECHITPTEFVRKATLKALRVAPAKLKVKAAELPLDQKTILECFQN